MRQMHAPTVAGNPPARSWAGRLAWALALGSTVLVLISVVVGIRYAVISSDWRSLLTHQLLTPFIAIAYAALGALVVSRQPRNPIGWLLVATGAIGALNLAVVAYDAFGGLPLSEWLVMWSWLPPTILSTMAIFFYFPNGHLPSGRWRLPALAGFLGLALTTLAIMFHPGPLETWGIDSNPFGLDALKPTLDATLNIGGLLLGVGMVASIAALIVRFRASRGVERQQMKWLTYAAGLLVAGSAIGAAVAAQWPQTAVAYELSIVLSNLAILGIAAAAAVAILRYRLYGIDLIVNRTLVYGGLTALVIAIYVVVVGAFGLLLRAQDSLLIALVATGLVAALFQPLRARLQRTVNRLVYGDRDDPNAVLAQLGRRLEVSLDPGEVFPTLSETVAQALRLPYVAVGLQRRQGLELVAEYGRPRQGAERFPLRYQEEAFGELIVEPRDRDVPFDEAERRLLETVARQASAAAYAARLNEDLQRSRERLVSAREEERRRLRRDLHDGLGPRLASQALKLEAARELLENEPERAEALIAGLLEQSQDALHEVRRLVYGLRPPALDELGLVAALREYLRQDLPPALRFTLEAPEPLPVLPAAVEVAAYRIVQEAVTNVIRHAQATVCQVRLELETPQVLTIEVIDNGVGLPPERTPGVGLQAMRERAEELGGSFEISSPEGGSRLEARLPLALPP